jgi:hypothetical protein
MSDPPWRFNPRPRVQALDFAGGLRCLVVDDALVDPVALRDHAVAHRDRFRPAQANAYPGLEWPAEAALEAALAEFFRQHVRPLLPVRRLLRMNARFGLVARRPDELQPPQWIPHRDGGWIEPVQAIAASVLYLFEDEALGGTGFYAPRRPLEVLARLQHAAATLDADAIARETGLGRGYPADSPWFERAAVVPPRFNRMLFYDGRQFHSGDIVHPERLSADPRDGRLTLNGFFTCSRDAT